MFRIIPDGEHFREYALLHDGTSVLLRAARPDDAARVEQMMLGVSPESLQMRFMAAVACVPRSTIEFMCTGDPHDRLSLLALVGEESRERVVGIGSYASLGASWKAEVACLVQDEFQGHGVSTLLLERLAGIAAAYGFIGFEADVLSDNVRMLNVLRDVGFEVGQAYEGSSIHVRFPVDGEASLRDRVELRDRIATANSLRPLLAPRTAAVVGASRDPTATGSLIFNAILRGEFTGTVYPVNARAASVQGVRAYGSLAELPECPDMAIVAVPADAVIDVARQALDRGTKGLLVMTSGFAEAGTGGASRQRELLALVRSRGARLIGPNCLGLQNTDPAVSLNASVAPAIAPRGRIGFYSHSAALGLVILQYAAERGLGFSTFVSAGNRADVSGNDLLEFWEEDPSTAIALLYLETFGNPRRFARIARRFTSRKPILCVKSARSRAGRDAARAHIGAAGQNDTSVDMLFHQAGVIRAETLEEVFDIAALLAHQPLPSGNRVGVISNSGGVLTICLDACESVGLVIAAQGVRDLGPLATARDYEAAVERAVEHPDVDALIAIYAAVGECDPDSIARGIRRGVARAEKATGIPKPALLCLMGDATCRHALPSYRFPESAVFALSRVVQYAASRRQPRGRTVWFDETDAGAAHHEVGALMEVASGDLAWMRGADARRLLGHFGIPAVQTPDPEPPLPILDVQPDPSFGPLLRLLQQGRAPVVRITPLTDRDAREMMDAAGLHGVRGIEELLGRISQLIEELPWLYSMTACIDTRETPAGHGSAGLAGDVMMAFKKS